MVLVHGSIYVCKMQRTKSFIALFEDKQSKVAKWAEKFKVPPKTAQHALAIDPTGNGEFLQWIIRQIAKKDIQPPEDNEIVKGSLTKFHKLKKTPRFHGEKDILQYSLAGDLHEVIDEYSGVVGKKEEVRIGEEEGIKHIGNKMGVNESLDLYLVTTKEAAAKFFRDTLWCVRDPKYFLKYKPNRYFFFTMNGEPHMLYHPERKEWKDPMNRQMSDPTAAALIGQFKLPKVFAIALYTEPESFFLKSPELAFRYFQAKGNFKAGEPLIAQNPTYAFLYSVNTGRPFPAGEKAIASEPSVAFRYAKEVLEGPFPSGEEVIARNIPRRYVGFLASKGMKPHNGSLFNGVNNAKSEDGDW